MKIAEAGEDVEDEDWKLNITKGGGGGVDEAEGDYTEDIEDGGIED